MSTLSEEIFALANNVDATGQRSDSEIKDDPAMTSIQIPLGPDKTWKIQVATKPTPEDVERFVQVIKIVLGGAPEKRERRISAKSTRISLTWTAS